MAKALQSVFGAKKGMAKALRFFADTLLGCLFLPSIIQKNLLNPEIN